MLILDGNPLETQPSRKLHLQHLCRGRTEFSNVERQPQSQGLKIFCISTKSNLVAVQIL